MKSFIFAILGLLCFAGVAMAGVAIQAPQPFNKYSSPTVSTPAYSQVYDTSNYRQKMLIVQGYAISGHAAASLSGTVLAQCGPTSTGPWNTSTGFATTAAGVAISTTANTVINWIDTCPYTRISWNKTAGLASVWFYVGGD
jgi:hypothetical protein